MKEDPDVDRVLSVTVLDRVIVSEDEETDVSVGAVVLLESDRDVDGAVLLAFVDDKNGRIVCLFDIQKLF